MPEISATGAARGFSELLDAVEHRGEAYTIVGEVVASLAPVSRRRGAEVKALLRDIRADPNWQRDLRSVRELLELDVRPRPDCCEPTHVGITTAGDGQPMRGGRL